MPPPPPPPIRKWIDAPDSYFSALSVPCFETKQASNQTNKQTFKATNKQTQKASMNSNTLRVMEIKMEANKGERTLKTLFNIVAERLKKNFEL